MSLNTAAAVRVGKHRISYQPSARSQRMILRINDEVVDLPRKGIDLGGGNRVANASSGGGIEVFSSDGTRVIITPNYWSSQGYSYLNIEVLNTPAREGTMGHILSSNWLPLAPDGSTFGPAPASLNDRHILLNKKFADAWRVTDASSLFYYDAGTSTADFTNRNWPPKPGEECKIEGSNQPQVKPMSPERAKALCRIIKDEVAFENCVFDATVMGDEGVAEAYQKTLKVRNGQ